MILESAEDKVEIEVMALAINLVCNKRNAQVVCEKKGLRMFMKRAFKYKDALIMKMLRNISQHDGNIKMLFVVSAKEAISSMMNRIPYLVVYPFAQDYISDLAGVIVRPEQYDENFALECLGILGNLTIPDLDYELIIKEFNLVDWIRRRLEPGTSEDDVVLEVIILIGTICNDDACAKLIADAGIIPCLIELLNGA